MGECGIETGAMILIYYQNKKGESQGEKGNFFMLSEG
jgi:hypothetical protein